MPILRFGLLFLSSLAIGSLTRAQALAPPEIDTYVDRAMKTFDVPGFALSIVKDGKVVYAKGYGVRRLGGSAAVDEQTLFFIGSTTKAFTAAALATLVDDGKLEWDRPIRTFLPWFAMYDPYASHEVSARDLLSHRSGLGLGEGDLLFLPNTDLTSREVIKRVQFLRPASSFRSRHAYSNLGVMSAAEVIPELTGQSWENYVRTRIFLPLGMSSTRTDAKALTPADNIASSHDKVHGKLKPVDWPDIPSANSVDGIISNVTDMSKWVMVQLNRGKLPDSDKRLFSEEQSRQMWTGASFPEDWPVAPQPGTGNKFSEYGMGWYIYDYRGARILEHFGGSTQTAAVVLMPEQNMGFVLFSNSAIATAVEVECVMKYLMDSILGVSDVDWITKHQAGLQAQLKEADETVQKIAAGRDSNSHSSLPPKSYAGTYRDPWYGEVQLSLESGRLVFRAPHSKRMIGDLEFWQHDVFVVRWRDTIVPDAYLYFTIKPDSTVEGFKMQSVSPLADFSFDFQDVVFTPVPYRAQRP
jgi:CubicO group peptidase (beta-lactamase class C family)